VISVSSACDGDSSAQRYRDNFTLVRFSGFVVIILNCELVWKIFCYSNRTLLLLDVRDPPSWVLSLKIYRILRKLLLIKLIEIIDNYVSRVGRKRIKEAAPTHIIFKNSKRFLFSKTCLIVSLISYYNRKYLQGVYLCKFVQVRLITYHLGKISAFRIPL